MSSIVMDTTFLFNEKFYVDIVTFRILGDNLNQARQKNSKIELGAVEDLISDIKDFGAYIKLNFPDHYDPYVYEMVTVEGLVDIIFSIWEFTKFVCKEFPIFESVYRQEKRSQLRFDA